MAEGSDLPGPGGSTIRPPSQFRFSLRNISPGQFSQATEGPRRLSENFTAQVIQGLTPLVTEHTRGVQNISLSSLLRHAQTIPRNHSHRQVQHHHHSPPNETGAVSSADSSESFVINLDNTENDGSVAQRVQQSVPPVQPRNGTRIEQPTATTPNESVPSDQTTETVRLNPETRAAVEVLLKYVPFVLILLAKGIYDHRTGLFIFLGLVITFRHGNNIVKREVACQAKRQLTTLAAVALYLTVCIGFIYFVFGDEKLYLSLVFIPPYSQPLTLWDLLWIVAVTDYVLKLITVMIKAAVVALPGYVMAFQKRGKVYLFIEQSSQLWRSLAPLQPWLYYLLEAYQGPSKIAGVLLAAAYMIAKGQSLLQRLKAWRVAIGKLLQNVNYGTSPSVDQLSEVGNQCPICHDEFSGATMLHCKHIFCEGCVATWFDREQTCPMCRAQVVDDPSWRDGSTTYFIQLF